METKAFSVPALASITTGVLLANSFSDMHEAAEWLMGHPIWTHEFGSKDTFERMRARVLAQHPDLDIDASDVNRDNVEAFRARLVADLGESREIVKGDAEREAGPVETLIDMLRA